MAFSIFEELMLKQYDDYDDQTDLKFNLKEVKDVKT